jgi:hypothetical protein
LHFANNLEKSILFGIVWKVDIFFNRNASICTLVLQ